MSRIFSSHLSQLMRQSYGPVTRVYTSQRFFNISKYIDPIQALEKAVVNNNPKEVSYVLKAFGDSLNLRDCKKALELIPGNPITNSYYRTVFKPHLLTHEEKYNALLKKYNILKLQGLLVTKDFEKIPKTIKETNKTGIYTIDNPDYLEASRLYEKIKILEERCYGRDPYHPAYREVVALLSEETLRREFHIGFRY